MKLPRPLVVALALSFSPLVLAQAAAPRFDITGVWESSGGGTVQVFQKGAAVTALFVGPDFAHRYEARYKLPREVRGQQVRVTRASGCTTHMAQRYDVVSEDLVYVTWLALDSNCDLVKGQTAIDIITRVQ